MNRTFLYCEDVPKGKIFDDQDEYDQAVKDGWVESPAAIDKTTEKPVEREPEKPVGMKEHEIPVPSSSFKEPVKRRPGRPKKD